jgi:ATP-dependent DNA helicase PIF1
MNKDQTKVLEKIKDGENIFITGGAGVGKSFLITGIIEHFVQNDIKFGVTAMTGSASIIINGRTIHSFMKMGLAKGSATDILKKIQKYPPTLKMLVNLKALIIDEVSMLSDSLFEKIGDILQLLHKSSKPFGDTQMILVGDMSQLKPIEGGYCFKSGYFQYFTSVLLTENMRVSDDLVFKNLLDEIRWGKCSPKSFKILENLKNTVFPDHIVPTRLFSKNADVNDINEFELNKLIELGNKTMVYKIKYNNAFKIKESKEYVSQQKLIPLTLCVGAQVVVTRNINPDMYIVNGTRGTVAELSQDCVVIQLLDLQTYTITFFNVKTDNGGIEQIDFAYIPLKLAWGLSIHSSQGMTLNALEIDLGDSIFAEGQAYTGLSRAKNLGTLRITKLLKRSFKTNKDIIEFYKSTGRTIGIAPHTF